MTTPMGVGQMRPHFSLGERNGRARSKRDIGGGFRDSPSKPPLKTTKRGGCGPLFGNSTGGAAAGLKVRRFDKHPGNLRKRHNLRHKRNLIRVFQRTRMRPGGFYPVVANNRPHPQTCPHGQVWTKRLFLPPCTAHPFSPRRKRMGGASPTPQVCGSKKSHRQSL